MIKISPITEGERSKRKKKLLKCNALSKSILHFKISSDLHSYASVHTEIWGRFPNKKGTALQHSPEALGLLFTHSCNPLMIYFLIQVISLITQGYFATTSLSQRKVILGDFIQSPLYDTEN